MAKAAEHAGKSKDEATLDDVSDWVIYENERTMAELDALETADRADHDPEELKADAEFNMDDEMFGGPLMSDEDIDRLLEDTKRKMDDVEARITKLKGEYDEDSPDKSDS